MSEDAWWEINQPKKIGYTMPVSFEVLIDNGAMTEDEAIAAGWVKPERRKVGRWEHFRWTFAAWRYDHLPRVHFGPCDHRDC